MTSQTISEGNELRPADLASYVNQETAKTSLYIAIRAALARGTALDHVLLHGPPGLGKTTLAGAIAHEMGGRLRVTSGPAIDKPGEMMAICSTLRENDCLFVDEIHRLPRGVEEVLYPVMEDHGIDMMIGAGEQARSVRLRLPAFTLIGATTRFGMLTPPLRDRFGHIHRLEYYSVATLVQVVTRSAGILGLRLEPDAATEIAARSRGTPRIANRLLARSADYAAVMGDGQVTTTAACGALNALQIDELGLDRLDRDILTSLIDKFRGGPVGIATLAASVNEDEGTVATVAEPYLQNLGFIQRTPRGRVATPLAYEHIRAAG